MNTVHVSSKLLAIAFTMVTCLLSWSFLWAVYKGLRVPPWAFLFILMWIPAAVAIGFRIIFHEGFGDAGFRAGPPRYWVIAIAVPLALATVTYLVAWIFGFVEITPYLKQQSMFGPVLCRMTWFDANASVSALLGQRFAIVMTVGLTIGFASGLGEEIGWRGYLLPRLIKAHVRFPILISGIIWAVWHVPFVLLTFQHRPVITAILYSLLVIVFAVFIGWIRLASGSVFAAAMAHGAYNTFYQDFYDHSFAGAHKWFWAGEVGMLCSVAFGAFAAWLYATNRTTPLIQRARNQAVVPSAS